MLATLETLQRTAIKDAYGTADIEHADTPDALDEADSDGTPEIRSLNTVYYELEILRELSNRAKDLGFYKLGSGHSFEGLFFWQKACFCGNSDDLRYRDWRCDPNDNSQSFSDVGAALNRRLDDLEIDMCRFTMVSEYKRPLPNRIWTRQFEPLAETEYLMGSEV